MVAMQQVHEHAGAEIRRLLAAGQLLPGDIIAWTLINDLTGQFVSQVLALGARGRNPGGEKSC